MKFRLLAAHVLPDQSIVPAGTKVGDEEGITWRDANGEPLPVSTQMDGLDDEGRQMVQELHQKLYGTGPYWDQATPKAVQEARDKEAEEQKKLDEGSEPVSMMQKAERKWMEDAEDEEDPLVKRALEPANVVPPRGATFTPPPHVVRHAQPGPSAPQSSTLTASPTRGGTQRPSQGPATPKPPEGDEARNITPNKDQYPKDG